MPKHIVRLLVLMVLFTAVAYGAKQYFTVGSYLFWRGTKGTAMTVGIVISAMLVMFSMLMMCYNVVIGGQEIAKTGEGLLTYQFEIFGRDGLIAAASVVIAPLIFFSAVVRFLPPWHDPVES